MVHWSGVGYRLCAVCTFYHLEYGRARGCRTTWLHSFPELHTHGFTCQFLFPLVPLHTGPLFDEVFRLRTNLKLKHLVENLDVDEESTNAHDLLSRLKVEVAERQQAPSVVSSPFEVFDAAELVEKSDHDLVGALLRYIFDEHFLPNLLFRTHYIYSLILGTPRGLTVMLPPCVNMGVMVRGSSTA